MKLMQDNVKGLWMWLGGMAAVQFVILYWVTSQVPLAGMDRMMMSEPHSSWYIPLIFIGSVGSFLVVVGLMRGLLVKVMPNGTKITGFWMTAIQLLVAGIIIGLLCGVGFLVFILPGIWLAVAFMFASYEIIANGKGVWSGPVSSFNLVKGRWWGVFGRFMMAVLWIILLEIVCGIVIGIINLVVSAVGLSVVGVVISDLLHAALAVLVAYFTLCWNINLYRSLKSTPVAVPAPAPAAKA